jgi:hypothetical protein
VRSANDVRLSERAIARRMVYQQTSALVFGYYYSNQFKKRLGERAAELAHSSVL